MAIIKLVPMPPENKAPAIGEFLLIPTRTGTWEFQMRCPNGKGACAVAIIRGPMSEIPHLHGWDGDMIEPTITPSIGCDLAPRCGWHGHITKGVRNP